MPTLIFLEHDGTEHRVDAPVGTSAMQAAVNASVPGILADCGGACACATCHAYVEHEALQPPSDMERDMAECAVDFQANSRLTCQILVSEAMNGLVIRLPRSQL